MRHSFSQIIVSVLFVAKVQCSCDYGTRSYPREAAIPEPKFGYDGLQGPLNWAALDAEVNVLCRTGTHQSPINLVAANVTMDAGSAYKLTIPDTAGSEFENLGTTVEVIVNGTLETAIKKYTMAQFHFHTPSEHQVNGEYFPMESHFVFEAEDQSKAVVSFLIGIGTNDPLLGTVLPSVDKIATVGTTTMTPPLSFAALQTHFSENTVFRYIGSLTTPPCSESVDWIISSKPLTVDAATFEATKKIIGYNSRYTQGDIGSANLLDNAVKVATAA